MFSAITHVRRLYALGEQHGNNLDYQRDLKRAEYRLVDLVRLYARQEGSMNDAEYDFLMEWFPYLAFDRHADYDQVNQGYIDVLLLLEKWIV